MGFYVEAESGVKIYVEDINPSGDKTIVFVHGWPGNLNLFEYQYNQLPRLGYRCVSYGYARFRQIRQAVERIRL